MVRQAHHERKYENPFVLSLSKGDLAKQGTFGAKLLSALGEIANIITGNAATHLAAAGYTCAISPPVIIEPAGSRFTTVGGSQILVTFGSDIGKLSIHISLSETRK